MCIKYAFITQDKHVLAIPYHLIGLLFPDFQVQKYHNFLVKEGVKPLKYSWLHAHLYMDHGKEGPRLVKTISLF